MTAYLIVFGLNPTDRFAAYSFPDRPAARIASLPASGLVPRVPPDGVAGGHAYLVETEEDIVRSPLANQLIAIYNTLAGTGVHVNRFESRSVGVRRLLELLASTARPAVELSHQENTDMPRPATVGEFRPIRRASKLGRIVAAVDNTSTIAAIATSTENTHEDVARLLKIARRDHGVDHSFDSDTGVVTLVLPDGVSSALESEREPRAASNGNGTTKTKILENGRVKLLVEKNPKRQSGSGYARFALYHDGMTVAEYLAAGGTRADLSWDRTHQFISIE